MDETSAGEMSGFVDMSSVWDGRDYCRRDVGFCGHVIGVGWTRLVQARCRVLWTCHRCGMDETSAGEMSGFVDLSSVWDGRD